MPSGRIVGEQLVPFPLIGEPERAVYARYGVESSTFGFVAGLVKPKALVALAKGFLPGKMEGDKRLLPADFLIGPDLRIEDAYYAADISQHISFARIQKFLGDPPPAAEVGVDSAASWSEVARS